MEQRLEFYSWEGERKEKVDSMLRDGWRVAQMAASSGGFLVLLEHDRGAVSVHHKEEQEPELPKMVLVEGFLSRMTLDAIQEWWKCHCAEKGE